MNTSLIAGSATPLKSPVSVEAGSLRWVHDRAGGVVVIRHRTATQMQPAESWPDELAAFLGMAGRVAMVGAKRLDTQGAIAAMGEFVVHPKGFHHHGKGVPAQAYRFPEEVDTLAAGVAVLNEQVFDEVDGPSLLAMGQIGLLALGLAVRQTGRKVLAVPQVVVTDGFSPEVVPEEAEEFRGRFGFDWWSADLDEVQEKHFEDGLMWNVRYHATAMPFEKYDERGAMHWESYQKAEVFRQRAHHLVNAAKQCCPSGRLLDMGCGDGFFSHLLAQQGLEVLGIDPEAEGVAQSKKMTAVQTYPATRPEFELGDGKALPVDDQTFAAVAMFDVIEHLTNPVAVLRECGRVLQPGGKLLIITPGWQYGGWSDPVYHGFEYTMEELVRQVGATAGLTVVHTGQITGVYRDLVVVAQKA